ncbi:alpha and gamma adaptin binding protein p34-domain-containing protein [Truncatella angustata]|uniref:Alpha and gamma adaptin binding protein p34-domain-containing protein n=1 Tax=Truncatella angustata TaxID=152316 RepID=A0A9P8ZWN2_9PEZI|nr:alpha and gamma adaptin binding protein p34-domain-containing protein [Truncatella angustata]KAH6652143.1 alpha and gamma adaptin binding protein p34-domain-containing protein [Truncatella angustata]
MEVSNPRRILAVSLSDAEHHLSKVVKDLTGNVPETASTTLAGTTHDLELETAYYTASVPIWLDLISDPSGWSESFLSPEAKEVLNVLGGVVVVFPLPQKSDSDEAQAARDLIQHVGKVVQEGLGGWQWEGVSLCLGIGENDDVDEWDEHAAESGLEFVQVRAKSTETRNEYGEKTGISRAREALEANDWAQMDEDLGSDFGDFEESLDVNDETGQPGTSGDKAPDLDPESLDFGFDKADFEGLKRAIWNSGQEDAEDFMNGEPSRRGVAAEVDGEDVKLDDDEIQKLEGMMQKLQAVKDMSAGLPEEQRKRMAAKAVNEVMKDL